MDSKCATILGRNKNKQQQQPLSFWTEDETAPTRIVFCSVTYNTVARPSDVTWISLIHMLWAKQKQTQWGPGMVWSGSTWRNWIQAPWHQKCSTPSLLRPEIQFSTFKVFDFQHQDFRLSLCLTSRYLRTVPFDSKYFEAHKVFHTLTLDFWQPYIHWSYQKINNIFLMVWRSGLKSLGCNLNDIHISPVTNEWCEWGSSPENPIIYQILLNFLLVPLWQISHFMLFQVLP